MSSKVRISKSQIPNIRGTKPAPRNAQLLVSTGIPSLDYFIGGGLPVGSLLVIEEDAYSTYSNVMYRYFVAEGIVSTHSILVASQDLKPSQILSELPAVEENETEVQHESNKNEEMKIAWRYKNMKIVDSSPSDDSAFGHYYDLSKKMKQESIDNANVELWDGENIKCQNNVFENDAYMHLLLTIEKAIFRGKFLISQTNEKKNILRLAINSLGSRLWLSDSSTDTEKDLLKFMYMLKTLLRQSFTVAIITIPVLNFDDDTTGVVQRIEHLSDVVIGLESFAGSSKETNPVFKDYNGLLKIKKFSAFNTLNTEDGLFNDLVFKLRRKKFLVEIMHLPPEFDDTTQREQDDISSAGCGGTSSNSKLDF